MSEVAGPMCRVEKPPLQLAPLPYRDMYPLILKDSFEI